MFSLLNKEIAMLDSEKMVVELVDISEKYDIGIIDSLIRFVEERNVDIEDIIPLLDKSTIDKIKQEALRGNLVSRKKFKSEKIVGSLFF